MWIHLKNCLVEVVLSSTYNLCFGGKIRKTGYPSTPQFYCIKVENKGVCITWTCLRDVVVVIFSDRYGLEDKEKVEEIQKIYVDALTEYEDRKRLLSGCCLARLLLRLSDLRSISMEHSKMLTMMKMDDSLMPNIVQDIYIQNS